MRALYQRYLSNDKEYVKALRNILGFLPGNLALYRLALRHKSVASDVKHGVKNSNERLEFLGDAVLGMVIAEVLFKKFPFKDEGFLTEMRSKIVNRAHLNQLAYKIGVADLIVYDTRLVGAQVRQSSLLGDAFEALVGAVYLDKGYDFTRSVIVQRIIKPHIDIEELVNTELNFKSKILEWCQREGKELVFEVVDAEKDGKHRIFSVRLIIDGKEYAVGKDFNKKNAEKIAAEKACQELGLNN